MSMFGKLFSKAKKVQNKDIMEAVIAGCLLVAYADGICETEEMKKMTALIEANENLEPFKREIQSTIKKFTSQLEADFGYGKKKMLDQIADISDNDDYAEEVFLNVLAVAKSDSEIEPEEMKVINEVANVLRISVKDFGLTA